ncbi:MAG TPA: hypothetical protein VIE16_10660 [Phenylobacterium sp.]|jgi:hypothetical protein
MAAIRWKAMSCAAALALTILPGIAAGQAPPPPRTDYRAPRAADGHPDLQGAWTNASLTRLERDAKFGGRVVLTQAEADQIEGRNKALIALGDKKTDPNATVKDLPADCSDGRGNNCNYNAAWTDPGTTVMRVAGKPRSAFITTTADGKVPPLTPEGQARIKALIAARRGGHINDNPETRSLGERCILSFGNSAGPVMLPLLYNNQYEIVQTKDNVAIVVEMVHDVRNVRMNAAAHLPPSVRPWMGDSIGHWDGETLVIETTNFNPEQNFRGASQNLKVTERLTRVGPNRMHYAFWVEDPTTFTHPWGGEYEFSRAPGRMFEYACHEGNYGLADILSGAREEDRTGIKTAPTNAVGEGGDGD